MIEIISIAGGAVLILAALWVASRIESDGAATGCS